MLHGKQKKEMRQSTTLFSSARSNRSSAIARTYAVPHATEAHGGRGHSEKQVMRAQHGVSTVGSRCHSMLYILATRQHEQKTASAEDLGSLQTSSNPVVYCCRHGVNNVLRHPTESELSFECRPLVVSRDAEWASNKMSGGARWLGTAMSTNATQDLSMQ
jgi:hypothetical protein